VIKRYKTKYLDKSEVDSYTITKIDTEDYSDGMLFQINPDRNITIYEEKKEFSIYDTFGLIAGVAGFGDLFIRITVNLFEGLENRLEKKKKYKKLKQEESTNIKSKELESAWE